MIKPSPKVSILMPNYNCWDYIEEAIQSILSQSYTDFEFIIIDDGSSDNSWDIIQSYAKKDSRITAMQNEENLWIQFTRNKLFENAKWEYYALFDSDDISTVERIEKQVRFLDDNDEYILCGSNFVFINKESIVQDSKIFPESDEEIKKAFFFRNPIWQNSVMVRASGIREVNWYDHRYAVTEDLDLWIRLWANYKLYNIQENLLQYRVHGENSIFQQQKEMIKNALIIRKNAMKLWYKITFSGRVCYLWTWFMQFLPPKTVFWLFNKIILKKW